MQCRRKPKWAPSPELQQFALNFLATFLVVTLQNNNRHTSARAQKNFPIRNMRPLSIREVSRPGGGGTGVFPPALVLEWVYQPNNLRTPRSNCLSSNSTATSIPVTSSRTCWRRRQLPPNKLATSYEEVSDTPDHLDMSIWSDGLMVWKSPASS